MKNISFIFLLAITVWGTTTLSARTKYGKVNASSTGSVLVQASGLCRVFQVSPKNTRDFISRG